MGKDKKKTTIEHIAARIASRPKVTAVPKPVKIVTVKKDPNSPFIALFPIADHLPDLINALPAAGIATRDDLLERVALETGSTKIAAQKTDEFLDGAAFVSFKNSKGAVSSVARIAAQATGISFQTVYGSYVSKPVAQQRLSEQGPETLSSFPLAAISPDLAKKLIEKGNRTPTNLVTALKKDGFLADAAIRTANQILRGQIYDDRNRLTTLGKMVFKIAGSNIPPEPAVDILPPKNRRTSKWRGKQPKALTTYPLNDSHPDIVVALVEKGIATRADFIDALKKKGFKASGASIGADKVLRGKLLGRKNRLSSVARAAYEIAGLELPAVPNIVPAQKQAKTIWGGQPKALTAYPLNDSRPDIVAALAEKGIATRADLVKAVQAKDYKASAAKIGIGIVLRGRLHSRPNQLSPMAKAIYAIAGLEVPLEASAPPKVRQTRHWILPKMRKALTEYPLAESHPELVAKLREKGIETRSDLIDALKKKEFKVRVANIGGDIVLRGKLLGRKNRLSPVARAAYEIAGLELPAVPNIVPAQKQAKAVRGSQPRALTTYPLNDSQPELVKRLIGAGIATRADMVMGFIKRGLTKKAATNGADKVLRNKLYDGRSNRLIPAAKTAFEMAGLELPATQLSTSPTARQVKPVIKQSKVLTDYPLHQTHPELIAGVANKGITRKALVDALVSEGVSKNVATLDVSRVLKGQLYGTRRGLSPAGRLLFRTAGIEPPAEAKVKIEKGAKTLAAQRKPAVRQPAVKRSPKQPIAKSAEAAKKVYDKSFAVEAFLSKSAARQVPVIPAQPVYRPFGVRRQDEENLDIFGFLQTEPVWKEKLTAGITLGSLLQDLQRRDQSAARALVNACSAIPAFLKSYPDAAQASDLERFQSVLAKQPYSLAVNKELKAKTGFIREFTETYNPSTYRHFVNSPHSILPGPPV